MLVCISGPGDVSPAKDAQEVLQCSIRSLLDSAVHDGEFQVQQLESQLKLVMEQQDITGNAAGQLIHKVHKLTSKAVGQVQGMVAATCGSLT